MSQSTIRLTMAHALVRHLAAQQVRIGGDAVPLFAGVFVIFGHGNVIALAYAKAQARKRMMTVITSIGPGATNLVTAAALAGWRAPAPWRDRAARHANQWRVTVECLTSPRDLSTDELPYEADVIGAVQRSAAASADNDIVVCASGGLPGELVKLWRTRTPGGYHVEYGYSCMGYEIAGGLGVKMAKPEREVIVMLGDGSYLMLNSEIATSVMLGQKLIIVVLDNRGFGCIDRLQRACGGAPYNNLLDEDCATAGGAPAVDFAAHARALGATAEHAGNIAELEQAMRRARAANGTYVISIRTDPHRGTHEGGSWWEVAVPKVSARESVRAARADYTAALRQRGGESGVQP
jgi:3D-(3,5/4)-trihydroxycyclohexane-1,2-dione acylhydrolase (decyclizing)